VYTCSLNLDQSSGSQHADTRAVLANDASFSVSAWVDPSECLQEYCAVVSQGADAVSAFTMGLQTMGTVDGVSCPCWVMSMPKADISGDEYDPSNPSGSGWYAVAAPDTASVGTWTRLTGVFDAGQGQLMLYLNGSQNPAATSPSAPPFIQPWAAPDPSWFRIGADWTSQNGLADFFSGQVSDVCAFYGQLGNGLGGSKPDVQDLYNSGCLTVIKNHPSS
jgi:hypothetical protein